MWSCRVESLCVPILQTLKLPTPAMRHVSHMIRRQRTRRRLLSHRRGNTQRALMAGSAVADNSPASRLDLTGLLPSNHDDAVAYAQWRPWPGRSAIGAGEISVCTCIGRLAAHARVTMLGC